MLHPGSRFALVAALGLVTAGASAADPPSGKEVLRRHLEAVGGRKAVEKVQSFHVQGIYKLPAFNAEGTIDLHYAVPDRLLFQVEIDAIGTVRRGLAGGVAWSMDPAHGNSILTGKELEGVQKQVQRAFSVIPRSQGLVPAKEVQEVTFDDRPCYKVTIKVAATGEEYAEYYDVETGLFAGREETLHTATGPVELHGVASAYKKFGDLLIATHWKHEAGGQAWTAQYGEFVVNSVDEDVFRLPTEIAGLLDHD